MPAGFQVPNMPMQRAASRKPVYYDNLKALPEEYSDKIGCLKNSNKGSSLDLIYFLEFLRLFTWNLIFCHILS